MTNPLRRDALLRLKVETDLARAVDTTARLRGQTMSEFVRQGLRAQLARHGVRLDPDAGPGPAGPASAMRQTARGDGHERSPEDQPSRGMQPCSGRRPQAQQDRPVPGAARAANLTQISAEREAAQAERDALQAGRAGVLLKGTSDDVTALDHRIALTKIRLDQLEIQHAAAVCSEAETQAAHEAEQKRRRDLHRKAMKASAETERLAAEYATEAQRLVPLRERIRERAAPIAEANCHLPDRFKQVSTGEPRVSWNDRPDQPHSSIANRVKLPGLGRDATPIW